MPGPGRPAYHLYRWLWGSLDLFFPPTCGGCGVRGERWCLDCSKLVRRISPPICDICGTPWKLPGCCRNCLNSEPSFNALRSWAEYDGPVSEAIKRLKYGRDISLGLILAGFLCELLEDLDWHLDLVIPVPLGVARLKERGYNQAALIAKPLALHIGLPYDSNALARVRETRSQVGLSFNQRLDNVKGAFKARPDRVVHQRILIIDDVATSSTTMDACSTALKNEGAVVVYGLTLARAV